VGIVLRDNGGVICCPYELFPDTILTSAHNGMIRVTTLNMRIPFMAVSLLQDIVPSRRRSIAGDRRFDCEPKAITRSTSGACYKYLCTACRGYSVSAQ
jgi:hypothetical protein